MWQVDKFGWKVNGSFTGVMSLFQHNQIEMLAHATVMAGERLSFVEFTAEIFPIE